MAPGWRARGLCSPFSKTFKAPGSLKVRMGVLWRLTEVCHHPLSSYPPAEGSTPQEALPTPHSSPLSPPWALLPSPLQPGFCSQFFPPGDPCFVTLLLEARSCLLPAAALAP